MISTVPIDVLLQFLAVVAVGCYVQTVTGFALGLTVMGGIAALGLMQLDLAAISVSLLVLINTSLALRKNSGNVSIKHLLIVLGMALPFIWLGMWLLHYGQDSGQLQLLKKVLGGTIIACAILLVLRPTPRSTPSHLASFFVIGSLAGLLGGMYATSGPPVVLHFYRQSWPQKVIRDTLLAIFFVLSVSRIAIAVLQNSFPIQSIGLMIYGVPIVLLFTWLGRRVPPKVSESTLRRIVFAILFLTGCTLLIG